MDLAGIRDRIDGVDKELVRLYEERMKLCGEVADYKIRNGIPVLDRQRESEKMAALMKMAGDDTNRHGIKELFTQIMAMSRKMQYRRMAESGLSKDFGFNLISSLQNIEKIVYQGERGAHTYDAARKYFGDVPEYISADTWRDAMDLIKSGEADYGVFPIENSSVGIVNGVYDLLVEYDNYIVAETYVKIRHSLLGTAESEIGDIKTVYSHPQALMQCQRYLDGHKDWNCISYSNTAQSAIKVAKDGDRTVAAIAGESAAKLYGLKVLASDINSNVNNTTRFVIISRRKEHFEDASKISICFELIHESGSLYNMLSHLIYNGLNMTKIESRPMEDRTWEYRFFVDIEGSLKDAAVKNAFTGMEAETDNFKILGNFK